MYDQSEFGGPHGKQRVGDRLFFGFRPHGPDWDATVSAARRLLQRSRITDRLRAEVLHSTLLIVSEESPLTDGTIERYKAVGDHIGKQSLRPFRMVFDRATRLPGGSQALVITPSRNPPEFKRVQRAARAALQAFNLPAPLHGLPSPHATLSYGQGEVDERIEPITWDVSELCLIQSQMGLCKHGVLCRWQLIPGPDLFDDLPQPDHPGEGLDERA